MNRIDTDTLHQIAILRIFNDSELKELLELGQQVRFESHANIVIEGEMSWGLYILLEGQVTVLKKNKMSGNVYEITQLKNGSYFGEMSLIDDQPRSATVRALLDTELFFISKDKFLNFLSDQRKIKFYASVIQDLVSKLRALDEDYVVSQYQLWKKALSKEESQEAA